MGPSLLPPGRLRFKEASPLVSDTTSSLSKRTFQPLHFLPLWPVVTFFPQARPKPVKGFFYFEKIPRVFMKTCFQQAVKTCS